MPEKKTERRKKCAGSIACGQPAITGSDYCHWHAPAYREKEEAAAVAEAGQEETPGAEEPVPENGNGICVKVKRMSDEGEQDHIHELRTGVAAIRTLLEEHLTRLDKARRRKTKTSEKEYSAALESNGKRVQSLSGELVEAIERLSRVEERMRKTLTPADVKRLLAVIRERVIRAVCESKEDAGREALAKRISKELKSINIDEIIER
jgi:hypothetical protein